MRTTTPPAISRNVRRLIERVVPGATGEYLTVQPALSAVANECFPNVQAKIRNAGGRMLCGWQIWEWPHVLGVETENFVDCARGRARTCRTGRPSHVYSCAASMRTA